MSLIPLWVCKFLHRGSNSRMRTNCLNNLLVMGYTVTTQIDNSWVWETGTKDRNIPPLMMKIFLLSSMYFRKFDQRARIAKPTVTLMLFEFSFYLNFFIFMCDVLNVIDLHKNVNINIFLTMLSKKRCKWFCTFWKWEKNYNELIKIFYVCVLIESKFNHT